MGIIDGPRYTLPLSVSSCHIFSSTTFSLHFTMCFIMYSKIIFGRSHYEGSKKYCRRCEVYFCHNGVFCPCCGLASPGQHQFHSEVRSWMVFVYWLIIESSYFKILNIVRICEVYRNCLKRINHLMYCCHINRIFCWVCGIWKRIDSIVLSCSDILCYNLS